MKRQVMAHNSSPRVSSNGEKIDDGDSELFVWAYSAFICVHLRREALWSAKDLGMAAEHQVVHEPGRMVHDAFSHDAVADHAQHPAVTVLQPV